MSTLPEPNFAFDIKGLLAPERNDDYIPIFLILYQPPGLDWKVVGQALTKTSANKYISKPFNLQHWKIDYSKERFMIIKSIWPKDTKFIEFLHVEVW